MRLLLLLQTLLLQALLLAAPAIAAPARAIHDDSRARTAIVSAFPPEIEALRASVAERRDRVVNGVTFTSGTIAGRPVVVFLSGISMVNAAMTTQLALDRYRIDRIVFSGIAGGVDPALDVGDVVVPARWAQYLESTFARAVGDGYDPRHETAAAVPTLANYGMIFPTGVRVTRSGESAPEAKLWFDADAGMLAIARAVAANVRLAQCDAALCLRSPPRIVVGGRGLSGPVFMDNAAFRAYAFKTFDAQAIDMETAAVGQVAYANRVPFIGFRSLSDLAGGDPGQNQERTFFRLASANAAAVVKAFVAALPVSAR